MKRYVLLDREALEAALTAKVKELRKFEDSEYSAGRQSGVFLAKSFVNEFCSELNER